ncbi:MAG: Hpt domain-containing protein [Pirellula sp.]|jgi:HPt (histidine-containing phosphotransfer) domain-containing protein
MNTQQNTKSASCPLYSNLAGDPDFSDLLHDFVNNLSHRQQSLKECLDKNEPERLTRIIHQLKGACGGYGFPTLTEAARILEDHLRQVRSLDEIRTEIEVFIETLSLATAELPKPRH